MVGSGMRSHQGDRDARWLPKPHLLVHGALTDDDLEWINEHMSIADGPKAIRGPRDIPVPPPPSGKPIPWMPVSAYQGRLYTTVNGARMDGFLT